MVSGEGCWIQLYWFLIIAFSFIRKEIACLHQHRIINSPEPKAQWRDYRIRRVCHPYVVCQHFQTSSPQKPLGRLKPNFMWSHLGTGERKFVQTVLVTWPSWPLCPYMVKKPLKIFFAGTKRSMTLKLVMQQQVLKYYQVCSNDDPGLTLTYFTAKSHLVPYAFVLEKGKTNDFSENTVVYDLKLATDDRSDKKFLLTSKLCPLSFAPAPGLLYMY